MGVLFIFFFGRCLRGAEDTPATWVGGGVYAIFEAFLKALDKGLRQGCPVFPREEEHGEGGRVRKRRHLAYMVANRVVRRRWVELWEVVGGAFGN